MLLFARVRAFVRVSKKTCVQSTAASTMLPHCWATSQHHVFAYTHTHVYFTGLARARHSTQPPPPPHHPESMPYRRSARLAAQHQARHRRTNERTETQDPSRFTRFVQAQTYERPLTNRCVLRCSAPFGSHFPTRKLARKQFFLGGVFGRVRYDSLHLLGVRRSCSC